MQKFVLAALSAIFLMSLAGCSGLGSGGNADGENPSASADSGLEACMKMDIYENQGECIKGLVKKRNDASLCAKAITQDKKDDCYTMYSYDFNDFATCEKIVDSDRRDMCYWGFAENGGGPAICERLENQDYKSQCLSDAPVREMKESEKCAVYSDPSLADMCYASAAASEGDAAVCNNVRSAQSRDGCISAVAMASNNEKLCAALIAGQSRDNCYFYIAGNKMDLSVCAKAGSMQQLCESAINARRGLYT